MTITSTEAAPQEPAVAPGFDTLVERLMALVPPAPAPGSGTTWIERRVREFDMRSAFGDDE